MDRLMESVEGILIGVGSTSLLEKTGFFYLDGGSRIAFIIAIAFFAWGYIISKRYKLENGE